MAEVRLPVIADTYIDLYKPNDNFGKALVAYAGLMTVNVQRALFNCDYTKIPNGATVERAVLRAYVNSYGSPPQKYGTYRIVEPWSEDTVTWNTHPKYYAIKTDEHEISRFGWFEWDVTSIVQHQYKYSGERYGILIRGTEDQNSHVGLKTKEWENPSEIVVYYTTPEERAEETVREFWHKTFETISQPVVAIPLLFSVVVLVVVVIVLMVRRS